MKTRLTSLLAVVVLVLVMAVPAFAQNATQDGYSATAGQVQAQVDDESTTPVAVTTSGGVAAAAACPSPASMWRCSPVPACCSWARASACAV
jgi:hypothetical protein